MTHNYFLQAKGSDVILDEEDIKRAMAMLYAMGHDAPTIYADRPEYLITYYKIVKLVEDFIPNHK